MSDEGIIDLDREAVKRGLADASIMLIDVREPQEYSAGHIPGSISMPLSTFDPRSMRMQHSAATKGRIVFSCATGVRSERVLKLLQEAGLPFREHYPGGYKDWIEAGEPVV